MNSNNFVTERQSENSAWLYTRDAQEFEAGWITLAGEDVVSNLKQLFSKFKDPTIFLRAKQAQRIKAEPEFETALKKALDQADVDYPWYAHPRFTLLSNKSLGVSYYKSEDAFLRESRTATKATRFLADMGVRSENAVLTWKKIIGDIKDLFEVVFVDKDDKDMMREVYRCDPGACMSPDNNDLIQETDGDMWPCDVLVGCTELQLVALRDKLSGIFIARTIINPANKKRTRVRDRNGTDRAFLEHLLNEQGYSFSDKALIGCRVRKIEYEDESYVGLWIDRHEKDPGDYHYDFDEDENYFVLCRSGYSMSSNGYFELEDHDDDGY